MLGNIYGCGGFVYRGLGETGKERSVNGVSVCGSSVRGTCMEGSITGNSESYITNVKEGFGNGASHSFYRLREFNLEGGLLY